MKKHLTRFLPLGRTPDSLSADDSSRCPAFARVQNHVEELRRFFDLPANELFLDEFYCALSKRILLQGRMYIFEHYLCFYSNVFGWVKQKVIPLELIKEITKKRNYGFSNSIEVVWKKREFLTSFLNRNDAYELLCDAVRHVQETEQHQDDDNESMPSTTATNPPIIIPLGKDLASMSSVSSSGTTTNRPCNERAAKRRSKGSSDADGFDSDMDENDEDSIDIWKIIPGQAPSVPDNMELLSKDRFDVTVQEFFSRILSMDSIFLDEYHKRRGDTRYRISSWEELPEISGAVRQAAFVSPVKGVGRIGFISPKTTECNQDHRLCIYHGDHMVFQISQVMKDIPYGDNFSVEIRWDVRPVESGGPGCEITIHVAVPFIRSVLAPFRSVIESNVMKEMQQSVKLMVEMLKDAVLANEEIEDVGTGMDPLDDDDDEGSLVSHRPAAQMNPKLQNLLNAEQNVQRLEQLIGSTELRQGISPTMELPPSSFAITSEMGPYKQQRQQSEVSLPPVNWVLFFSCIFILFCQIMLVVLWIVAPPSRQGSMPVERYSERISVDQLQQLEETLLTVVRMLNATISTANLTQ